MKTAGGLLLGAAILIATVLGIYPTHVNVLGMEGSCGVPVVRAFVPVDHDDDLFGLNAQCKQQSTFRVLAAGGILLSLGLAGALIVAFTPSRAEQERRRFQQWQHWQAEQHYAQQYADYERRLAEWERNQAGGGLYGTAHELYAPPPDN